MAQVNVTINEQVFRIGCEEGQEDTLIALAEDIDRRIENFRASFGEVGNMRLLIMAALELGDELGEVRRALEAAQAELAERRDATSASEDRMAEAEQLMVDTLDSATRRVEALTADLGSPAS